MLGILGFAYFNTHHTGLSRQQKYPLESGRSLFKMGRAELIPARSDEIQLKEAERRLQGMESYGSEGLVSL